MSGSLDSSANAEPNLTPILDMVFQLITFFMLVMNFKAAALDLDLKLPVVGSARPVETGGRDDLVVLNVNQEGRLKVYGSIRDDVEGFIKGEALASLTIAQRVKPDLKFGDELPSTIVIRADKRTPFALLNKVIKLCQDSGYRNFALKAMNRTEAAP